MVSDYSARLGNAWSSADVSHVANPLYERQARLLYDTLRKKVREEQSLLCCRQCEAAGGVLMAVGCGLAEQEQIGTDIQGDGDFLSVAAVC